MVVSAGGTRRGTSSVVMSLFRRLFGDGRSTAARAAEAHRQAERPAPKGRNNFVLVVLDSCRFDSFVAATPATICKLGRLERRWSYASWTAPSHYNLLMGLLPHSSPQQVY